MGGAHVQSTDADALEPATPSTASARFQAVVVCRDASANPLRIVGGITLLERLLRQLSELETVESILLLKPIDLSLPTPSKRVRKDVIYQDTSGTTAWEMLRDARAHLRRSIHPRRRRSVDRSTAPLVADRANYRRDPESAYRRPARNRGVSPCEIARRTEPRGRSRQCSRGRVSADVLGGHARRGSAPSAAHQRTTTMRNRRGTFFWTISNGGRRSCPRAISIPSSKT